ncbi:hypothetical protein [Cohnella sp. REN36]|nr:hypothetical protein [Cohnella sp. REN36]
MNAPTAKVGSLHTHIRRTSAHPANVGSLHTHIRRMSTPARQSR